MARLRAKTKENLGWLWWCTPVRWNQREKRNEKICRLRSACLQRWPAGHRCSRPRVRKRFYDEVNAFLGRDDETKMARARAAGFPEFDLLSALIRCRLFSTSFSTFYSSLLYRFTTLLLLICSADARRSTVHSYCTVTPSLIHNENNLFRRCSSMYFVIRRTPLR